MTTQRRYRVDPQAAIDVLFTVDTWPLGGPHPHEAGDLIHRVRNAAHGDGVAWSFPLWRLGHTGRHWRLWGEEAVLLRLREAGVFEAIEAEGALVGAPRRWTVDADEPQGVAFVRTRVGEARLGPSRQRRLERRLADGRRRPSDEVHAAQAPARNPAPPSHLYLTIPSHRPSAFDGQPVRVPIVVQETPRHRGPAGWGGWADAWGFSTARAPLVLPNERQTPGLVWA